MEVTPFICLVSSKQTSQNLADSWIYPEVDSLPGGRSEAMLGFFGSIQI